MEVDPLKSSRQGGRRSTRGGSRQDGRRGSACACTRHRPSGALPLGPTPTPCEVNVRHNTPGGANNAGGFAAGLGLLAKWPTILASIV
eukprot:scaffold78429_cov52-Phaeocystis_antarctica.AAC.2